MRIWTIAFMFLFPATGWAVPSIVQCLRIQGGTVTGMTSSVASFTGPNCQLGNAQTPGNCVPPTAGNLMVIAVVFAPVGGVQNLGVPTDNQGTSYAQDVTHARLDNFIRAHLFSGHIQASSGTFTVSVPFTNFNGSLNVMGWTACEVAGLDNGPQQDQIGGGDNQGAVTLTVQAQAANTNANDIAFTAFNSTPVAPPPGWTTIGSDNVTYYTYIGYRITNAIETSTMTANFGTIASSTGVLTSYKGNGATGPGPTPADSLTASINSGDCMLTGPTTIMGTTFTGMGVSTPSPPATCTMKIHNNTTLMADLISNPFVVSSNLPFLSITQQPTNTLSGSSFSPAVAGRKIIPSVSPLARVATDDLTPNAATIRASPSSYNAYTGTDVKPVPPPPALQGANTVFTDPTFGSEILRVTDANSNGGESFIPTDAGNLRTFNANNTAIKLTGPHGDGWWMEFNPSTFRVGDGSSNPRPHPIPSQYGATWQWSVTNPDIIYILAGNQIAAYNKSTGAVMNLGGPSTGEPVAYMAAVIGQDNWVCAAAGVGQQNTWTKLFCLQPSNPSQSKFVDIGNHTVNGAYVSDPNWPNPGVGIHGLTGGSGDHWIAITFHGQNWGGNGDAIFNLQTNTWQQVKGQGGGGDIYWGGHVSMGNGIYANGGGNVAGNDSRGIVLRNADNTMDASQYRFVGQPSAPYNAWCDAEHNSWHNSVTNPMAPIFQSRYGPAFSSCPLTWTGEILGIATDGSNTVYRFAHNHADGSGCYYGQAFAQVSNDGNWLLFSSVWGGTLGSDAAFGCSSRIDTFMIRLNSNAPPPTNPVLAFTQQPTSTVTTQAIMPAVAGTITPAAAHSLTLAVHSGNCNLAGTVTVMSSGTTGAWSFPGVTASSPSPPANCTLQVTDNTNPAVTALISNGFNVTANALETVTMSVNSGPCQLAGPTMVTMAANSWAFPGVTVSAPNPPAICTLRIHDSELDTSDAISNAFTVLGSAPGIPVLAFTQQPTDTLGGLAITPPVAGTITPPVAHSLTVSVKTGGCAIQGNQTVLTNASTGAWSFPGITVNETTAPQICTLLVRDNNGTGAAADILSNPFTVGDVGPTTHTLSWIAQPTTTATGTAITPMIRLRVDPIPPLEEPGIPVTLTVNGGCSLQGTLTQTSEPAVSQSPGVVTFPALTGGTLGTGCTITASAPGAASITSTPFSITNALTPMPPLTRFPVPRKP